MNWTESTDGDQFRASCEHTATLLKIYYDELLDVGFSSEFAQLLVMNYQEYCLYRAGEERNGS